VSSETSTSTPASASAQTEANEAAESLRKLEASVGHVFSDRGLLERAVTHSSYANETQEATSNETMEFLGDSVIGLAVSHMLFEAKPEWREGELTRALHGLVEGRSLAEAARRIDLGRHLRLGRTERQSDGHEKDSILEDAMEAIFAALYLDAGLGPVVRLARELFGEALSTDAPKVQRHPKMEFNERVMQHHGLVPRYRLLSDSGVDDDEARFEMAVDVDDEEVARGRGRTKRAAETAAAQAAVALLFADEVQTAKDEAEDSA
jgi:ribonuclease-3